MRASVTSLSKKIISTFFACALVVGLMPTMAFGVDGAVEEAVSVDQNETKALIDGDEAHNDIMDNAAASAIPAGEIINETQPLQVVAQQESTKSYFLAQTLESTRTVPVVSANLPLDTGMIEDAVTDSESETPDPEASEQAPVIAIESVVVGSFEQDGIVYAIEPGGASVAVVASDYAKLPIEVIESHTLEIPSMVTSDGIDYYSVTRIADGVFADLAAKTDSLEIEAAEEDVSVDTDSVPVVTDEPDASEDGVSSEMSSVDIVSTVVELTDGADSERTNDTYDADTIATLVIPASITTIGDDAFAGFTTLQYVIVSPDNTNYSSYDGCLYTADLSSLLLIPEGRTGAVRIAPSVTIDDSEVFSHCPSGVTLVADADGAASTALGNVDTNRLYDEAIGYSSSNLLSETIFDRDGAESDAKGPKVFYYTSGEIKREGIRHTNKGDIADTGEFKNGYSANIYVSTIKLVNECVEMFGPSSDGWVEDRTYRVGVKWGNDDKTVVDGVKTAWIVLTDSDGVKTGQALNANSLSLIGYSAAAVYLNGYGSFDVTLDANGGDEGVRTVSGVMPYQTISAYPYDKILDLPKPTRKGYRFAGWFTEEEGGKQALRAGDAAATYYAHWVKSTASAYYYATEGESIWRASYRTCKEEWDLSKNGATYHGFHIPSALRFISGYVDMPGASSDNIVEERNMRVGLTENTNTYVAGVTSAWLVKTDSSGAKTGAALGPDWVSVGDLSGIQIYLNGYGSFDVSFNANGGDQGIQTISGVMPYGSWTAPTATRYGYVIAGWYDGPGDDASYVCAANEVGPALANGTTLYAHWNELTGPKVTYYSSGKIVRSVTRHLASGDTTDADEFKSGYSANLYVSTIKLVDGSVEMLGRSSDAWKDNRTIRVGVEWTDENESIAGGVGTAWAVLTDLDGVKTGTSLGAESLSLMQYAAAVVYLNGYGSFDIFLDSNGGNEGLQTVSNVMPYRTLSAYPYNMLLDVPAPTREGYRFAGWFTDKEGGQQVLRADKVAATYYAHWTKKTAAPVFYADSGPIYRAMHQSSLDKWEVSSYNKTTYSPNLVPATIRMDSGCVEVRGASSDAIVEERTARVGLEVDGESNVKGVTSAWLVKTDSSGAKTGVALGPDWVSVENLSGIQIYLNGCGSFGISFDSNGGSESIQTVNGVMPYGSWTAPAVTRSGYIISGWYDGPGDDANFVCSANGAGSAIGEATTLFAHWAPVSAAVVPLSVTAKVDMLGIADQEAVLNNVLDDGKYQGYIESRSAGALDIVQVDFDPFAGAEALFGDGRNRVLLEALAEGSSSTDYSFALHQAASETNTVKLAPFSLDAGIGTRKRITYRFNIPDDVLAAIDRSAFNNKTTSVGRVSYTVAVAE